MKIIVAIFFCCLCCWCTAQKIVTKEIAVQTDNDAYLFHGSDRYYTNGLFFTYTNAIKNNKHNYLQSFTLGQMIFTPLYLDLTSTALMDRPFCGYLFAKYAQTHFIKNNQVLQWYGSAGTIGKTSLAQGFQELFHEAVGLYDVSGWEYQVKQSIAVNAGISYTPFILQTPEKFSFKAMPLLSANLGNVYTNAQVGALLSIGFINKTNASALFNASINNLKHTAEWFIYFQPQIVAQAYNATVQGSLFNNNKNAFTTQATAFMYFQTLGMAVSTTKATLKFEIHNQSKESTAQLLDHQYGSIQFAYRFK